jgi:hypothetical protein
MDLSPISLIERLGVILDADGSSAGPPPSLRVDDRAIAAAGYYMARDHGLVHRHIETVELHSDQSALWQLAIDFELPSAPEASYASFEGEEYFLFPLLFMRKAEERTGFGVFAEDEAILAMPTRLQCDRASAGAALQAGRRLLSPEARRNLPEDLPERLTRVISELPLTSAAVLASLERELERPTLAAWQSSGLLEDLHMLVEHWVVWMPFRGRPGERRVIRVRRDHELTPRPFVRWAFGAVMRPQRQSRLGRRRPPPQNRLDTGERLYGRRRYTISLSALAERLAKPLAWMPIELDFPSIYPRRCASYHFELICPDGLTPHNIKLEKGTQGEPESWQRKEERYEKQKRRKPPQGERTTLRTGRAHFYHPGGKDLNAIWIRSTVGVGPGAFPVLWFFAGAITAIMLWILAIVDPVPLLREENDGKAQVAAGVLLVVPALLGGLVVGVESRSTSQLLNGARVMLLAAGLSAVVAATVLVRQPFGLQCRWAWAICATVATLATIPLATSWALSVEAIWRQLERLDTPSRQRWALWPPVAVAAAILLGLHLLDGAPVARAVGGVTLLLLTVPLILLASNGGAIKTGGRRHGLVARASLAAATCFVMGCAELHAIGDPHLAGELKPSMELWGAGALGVVLLGGGLLGNLARRLGIGMGHRIATDRIDVHPEVGRALIAGEGIYELAKLREREEWALGGPREARTAAEEEEMKKEGRAEADWAAGMISTLTLPNFTEGEIEHLTKEKPSA